MPTPPPPSGAARPAAVVDAEIRALLTATGGWLWGPTRARYERLRDEWVQAVRDEVSIVPARPSPEPQHLCS